ncbi:hypothetical protein CC86DRAFT_5666 [Ophiobolus disseminans]|uniref:F-box domain-containing protein n=1 Tax=Ophiobolus disseminans TaxID=1469910 RepID=A0A6A7AIL6_9PLEO|nr:hypothetical protein CC86DRAFT_5666 [Ophiobolus disseminans]
MRHLRSSKLWLSLRHNKQPIPEPEIRTREATIGNGQIPIEILQEVFSYLDIWTLLLQCRRVCHLWSTCIPGNSPALRATLFDPKQRAKYCNNYNTSTQNPELHFGIVLFGPFTDSTERQRATGYTVHLRRDHVILRHQPSFHTINPLLLLETTRTKLKRYKASWNSQSNPEPLWMAMLVCQPPVQKLTIRVEFEGTDVYTEECVVTLHKTYRTLENSEGVTVGQLLMTLHEVIWWPGLSLTRSHGCVQVLPSVNGEIFGIQGAGSDNDEDT